MAGDFIDTNVLIYLASNDTRKADIAEAVLTRGGYISVQVLNELTNVARRKIALSWPETRNLLQTVSALMTVRALDLETHKTGLALAERYGFSIYDSMIVAAAIGAGCDRLLTEDMRTGMRLKEGLTIVNPFKEA